LKKIFLIVFCTFLISITFAIQFLSSQEIPQDGVNKVNYDSPITVLKCDPPGNVFAAIACNDLSAVKAFLADEDTVKVKDYAGCMPLQRASMQSVDIVKMLIENGADFEAKTEGCGTALYWAVSEQRKDIVKLLLENGANPYDTNPNNYAHGGTIPLIILAVNKGDIDIVSLFLEKAENVEQVNIKNSFGQTPLHWAVMENNVGIVKLLLEKGGDISIKDKYGKIPLDYVLGNNNKEIINLLMPE